MHGPAYVVGDPSVLETRPRQGFVVCCFEVSSIFLSSYKYTNIQKKIH